MDISNKLNRIEVLIKNQNILLKEFLTLEEAVEYLGLSKSAIYKMTSKKKIPYYTPGGKKVYFKMSELNKWVFSIKSSSVDECESEIDLYLNKPQKPLL